MLSVVRISPRTEGKDTNNICNKDLYNKKTEKMHKLLSLSLAKLPQFKLIRKKKLGVLKAFFGDFWSKNYTMVKKKKGIKVCKYQ